MEDTYLNKIVSVSLQGPLNIKYNNNLVFPDLWYKNLWNNREENLKYVDHKNSCEHIINLAQIAHRLKHEPFFSFKLSTRCTFCHENNKI